MAPNGVKVIEKDSGWKRIKRDWKKYSRGLEVRVGFQGEEGAEVAEEHQGLTNAALAIKHEFGTKENPPIPPRPFMRTTYDQEKKKIQEMIAEGMQKAILDNKKIGRALGLPAEYLIGKTKALVKSRPFAPLSKKTIAAREERAGRVDENPTPLIDTGIMLNSLTWVLMQGGHKAAGGK